MDPYRSHVDEAQLMSTEELPPDNDGLDASGSDTTDHEVQVQFLQ
jgi:hypothetical protein